MKLKPVWLVRWGRARPAAAPTRFRILTLNAGGNARAPAAPEIEGTIRSLDPDIVALQELTPEAVARLRCSLAGRYAYCHGGWPAIVFSRLPIRAGCILRFPSVSSDAQRVEIEIAGRTLVMFNVHITRPGYELDGHLARLRFVRDYDPMTRDTHAALVHAQVGRALLPAHHCQAGRCVPRDTAGLGEHLQRQPTSWAMARTDTGSTHRLRVSLLRASHLRGTAWPQ
jgi:hypothetical protein